MTWSLKTSVPYSSSTRLILRSLSQRSSIHSTQGKERMFRVYFDLAKCFETIDGNRGDAGGWERFEKNVSHPSEIIPEVMFQLNWPAHWSEARCVSAKER